MDRSTLARLSTSSRVVYLEAPEFLREDLYRKYVAAPKPVYWGNSFFKNEGETDTEALARCYPGLLAFRVGRYAELAHLTLDYFALRQPGFNIDKFIAAVS